MIVSVEIRHGDSLVAEIIYEPGFLVDIRVEKPFRVKRIGYRVSHHQHERLSGSWLEALDKYFNEWIFESRSDLFPDEQPRTGSGREHKSLFLAAARALEKDLTPYGYKFKVLFE
ncbi:MAG: hypothetical protein NTY51_02660 [Deltaproteobacteria bacterium]|nr:hypothetical protein [Deltaproteobacteria bacterium]